MVRSGWLTCVGLSLLIASPLAAQEEKGQGRRGAGGPGGRGFAGADMNVSKINLLASEQVLAEVKITPEQKKEIEALRAGLREGTGGRGGSQEEREKAREKRQQATAEAEKKLDGILKPEQGKRLDEIYIQVRGPQVLKDEKVAKELKLSGEQVTKINEAISWGQEERRKLFSDRGQAKGREAFTELREKQEKLQKDVDTKVLAALTDAQKEQFEKLKGSPFKLERGQAGGAGGQRGRRGQDKAGEKGKAEDKKI